MNSEFIEIEIPADLKMRPRAAGPSCLTSKLSSFLDTLLKPLRCNTMSYIRNTVDLSSLPQRVEKDTILATFDITNMYTNINNNLGI